MAASSPRNDLVKNCRASNTLVDFHTAVRNKQFLGPDLAPPDVLYFNTGALELRALAAARRDLDAPVDGDGARGGRRPGRELLAVERHFLIRRLESRGVLLLVEYFERPGAAERPPRRLRGLLVALDDREFPVSDPVVARVDRFGEQRLGRALGRA